MSRDWINYLDLSKIDIYPIQFANCDRLEKNDAVYIFDEVGSGKTISSGLMAIDYLENNDKDVLVITTNSLVRTGNECAYGQFLGDWFEKLPFNILNMKKRISIKNNFYTSFKGKQKYGLVIIDEAQLFLNNESLRYQYLLRNIKADKIVFLTATPIKSGKNDLYTYVNIAKKILNRDEIESDWIDNISTIGKEKEQIICNDFNIKSPVTRYFKDTIMAVNVDGFEKIQAKRLLPQVWEYEADNGKKEVMVKEIGKLLISDKAKGIISRFVVFTRLVEKEAYQIGDYLNEQGFKNFSDSGKNDRTYYVVTGKNAIELSYYSNRDCLPTILILTYQIAEQGVNLPGYNYVVNYSISSFPSSLEQRFGRIDRMGRKGSCYTEINMCYLLSKNRWDINTFNFYSAVFTYIYSLISYLPSKNTILTPKILDMYNQKKALLINYIDELDGLTCNIHEINSIITYFKRKELVEAEDNNTNDSYEAIDEFENNTLLKFCDDRSIIYDTKINSKDALSNLVSDIKSEISEMKRRIVNKSNFPEKLYQEVLDDIGDKVFYCKNEYFEEGVYSFFTKKNIGHFDAVNDGGVLLSQKYQYINYAREFNKNIKTPLVFKKYSEKADKFFCGQFENNNFSLIFPVTGYKKLFESVVIKNDWEIKKAERELLIEYCEQFIYTLPFFKMCINFKEILHSLSQNNNSEIYMRYSFNPFTAALAKLKYYNHGLKEDFYNKYWGDYADETGHQKFYSKYYAMERSADGVVEATNWYKLAYYYTRKESSLRYVKYSNDYFWRTAANEEDIFSKKEKLCRWLACNYRYYKQAYYEWEEEYNEYNRAYKVAIDGEDKGFNPTEVLKEVGFYGEPEMPEIIAKFENNELIMKELNKKVDGIVGCISLFYHYMYTNYQERKFRIRIQEVWKMIPAVDSNLKLYYSDIWTQGIYRELLNVKCDCMDYWTKIYGIPKVIYEDWVYEKF